MEGFTRELCGACNATGMMSEKIDGAGGIHSRTIEYQCTVCKGRKVVIDMALDRNWFYSEVARRADPNDKYGFDDRIHIISHFTKTALEVLCELNDEDRDDIIYALTEGED